MEKSVVILLVLLLLPSAFALQQIAGPLSFSVPVGSTGSAQYGLVNDGNETIFVKLRAEGDAAQYLSFPTTVELVPNKIVYTDIVANIPANYKGSSNLSGSLYAVQEGKPGQVQINVQMKKSVTISVQGLTSQPSAGPSSGPSSGGSGSTSGTNTITNNNSQPTQNEQQPVQPSENPTTDGQPAPEPLQTGLPVTGLAASLPVDLTTGAAIAAIIIIILVAFAILKKLGKI